MKKLTLACAFPAALSLPALADPGKGKGWGDGNGGGRDHVSGAPGPIAGAASDPRDRLWRLLACAPLSA